MPSEGKLFERRALEKSDRPIGALFLWPRYGTFSYSRADETSTALHSSRRTQDPCVILTVGPNGGWYPRICSMAVVWTLNVSDGGTRRPFSIEDRIWDGQRTSVSATLGASRGVPRQTRTSGGGLGDDFEVASLQKHFWVRNAPYGVKGRGNPLKSQQMRAPSERTKAPSRPRR